MEQGHSFERFYSTFRAVCYRKHIILPDFQEDRHSLSERFDVQVQAFIGITILVATVLGATWGGIRFCRNEPEQTELVDVVEPEAEANPEQSAELHVNLRVIVDTFKARSFMEQYAIFQLVYAICGFGPAGHLAKRGGQGLNGETWAWLYQTFTPLVNLPEQADDGSFETVTGNNVDEMLERPFVILCIVHFGDYIARVNTQLVGHPMRQLIPGINETTTAYDTFGWLWGLSTDYAIVPEESRDFFDKFVPSSSQIALPAVAASDTQYPETTGQLFMPPKERLGLYLCNDLDDVARRWLTVFAFAICGFGPAGKQTMKAAQGLYHTNSWSEFNASLRCIAGITDRVSYTMLDALAANTWFLGEAGAYGAYLLRVYYALTEEDRARCFDTATTPFDHESMIRQVADLSMELFPQHLVVH